MEFQFNDSWKIILILFVLLVIFFRLGVFTQKRFFLNETSTSKTLSIIETSIYALLGLILAFTYSASGERFASHRKIIVEEANCIGTAILRTELYPEEETNGFKEDFKKYVDLRIEYPNVLLDMEKLVINKTNTSIVIKKLWQRATRLARKPELIYATQQMIPALNNMFDINVMREYSYQAKVPKPIILLVFIITVLCGFIAGYNISQKSKRDTYMVYTFIMLILMVIYLILDLDRPQQGMIDTRIAQEKIIDLKELLK